MVAAPASQAARGHLAVGAVVALKGHGAQRGSAQASALFRYAAVDARGKLGSRQAERGAAGPLDGRLVVFGRFRGGTSLFALREGAQEDGALHPLVEQREQTRVDPVDVFVQIAERHDPSRAYISSMNSRCRSSLFMSRAKASGLSCWSLSLRAESGSM